jgi:hypothetical protein
MIARKKEEFLIQSYLEHPVSKAEASVEEHTGQMQRGVFGDSTRVIELSVPDLLRMKTATL